MSYTHCWTSGDTMPFPSHGKAVCIGRNFAAHISELGNEQPDEPVLFIKPTSAFVDLRQPISIPMEFGECHHEAELALLIGQTLTNATQEHARQAVAGYGLALDLTLRDLQNVLKAKRLPWERAKAFDGSCPLSPFIPSEEIGDPQNLSFSLTVNGVQRQVGEQKMMLWNIFQVVAEASRCFTLNPGDAVLTGTPAGVAALQPDDHIQLALGEFVQFETHVVRK